MKFQRRKVEGASALKVLGIGCAVLFLLCVGGVIVFVLNIKKIAANTARAAVVAEVQKSSLPEEQKARIVKSVDGLTSDFKSGKISTEQVGKIMEKILKGPLLPLGMVYGVEQGYVKPSELSDADKKAAALDLQRFARGVFEKKIPPKAIDDVLTPIQETQPDGKKRLKQKVTKEDLTLFLEGVRKKADEAKIPKEPFAVDIASEVEKAIREAVPGK